MNCKYLALGLAAALVVGGFAMAAEDEDASAPRNDPRIEKRDGPGPRGMRGHGPAVNWGDKRHHGDWRPDRRGPGGPGRQPGAPGAFDVAFDLDANPSRVEVRRHHVEQRDER